MLLQHSVQALVPDSRICRLVKSVSDTVLVVENKEIVPGALQMLKSLKLDGILYASNKMANYSYQWLARNNYGGKQK